MVSDTKGELMADVFSINCKNCGASAHFDPKTQKIKCDHCGKAFKLSEFNESDDIIDDGDENYTFETQEINIKNFDIDLKVFDKGRHSFGGGTEEEMSVYHCEKCGAEILISSISGTAKCPFCDNNLIFTEKFEGGLKPDLIIPFKKNKEDALDAYHKFLNSKTFLPSIFKTNAHIDEIQGLYVPYWIFDGDFDLKYLYKTQSEVSKEILIFVVTITSYYDCIREGTMSYKDLPRDASSRMRNDLMDSLEPFDLSEAEEFSTYYLAGYLAERFDVPAEDCIKEAVERMKTTIVSEVEDTVKGYDTKRKAGEQVKLTDGKIRYGLYPVWYLNTTYQNKQYSFVMNGQTGKVVGDNLPIDWLIVILFTVLVAGVLGVIIGIIATCFAGFIGFVAGGLAGVAIGLLIMFFMVRGDVVSIEKKKDAAEYISKQLNLTKNEDKLKKKRTKIRLADSDN